MESLKETKTEVLPAERSILEATLQRRSFLQFAGAGAAIVALTAVGCTKERNINEEKGKYPQNKTTEYRNDKPVFVPKPPSVAGLISVV